MSLLTRRVLIAGAGAAIAATPTPATIEAIGDGWLWTQAAYPVAIQHGSYLYSGGVDGATGDVVVGIFLGGVQQSRTTVHAALESPADSHDAPALTVRSDGRLLAVYTKHDIDSSIRQRVSVNTLASDPTIAGGFSAETTVSRGTTLTYPSLFYVGSQLRLYYRDEQSSGTTAVLALVTSSDEGATWSSQTDVYKSAGHQTYWQVRPSSRGVEFLVTDGYFFTETAKLFHFYNDGSYKKTDGTSAGSLPLVPANITLIDNASVGNAEPFDVMLDDSSNPVAAYSLTVTLNSDNRLYYAAWNGSAWSTHQIATAGGTAVFIIPQMALEAYNHVYATPVVSGTQELRRYETSNAGTSWITTNITSGSSDPNLYPTKVVGGAGIIWAFGTFAAYNSYDVGLKTVR